jgi:hypothetical protein
MRKKLLIVLAGITVCAYSQTWTVEINTFGSRSKGKRHQCF